MIAIEQMGTATAFLGDVEVFIEIDLAPGTGIHTGFTTGAFHRVNDHQAVLSLVDGALDGTVFQTGGIITMHAGNGQIMHLDLGDSAPDELMQFEPELAGIRLGFGIGSPVVGDMLILTSDLTVVTSVTD